MKKKIIGEKLTRAVNIGAVVDEDERTVEVSLSSEYPVPRWDGDEVLIHEKEAIDLSRFPLPLCVAHETYRGVNIGLIEDPKIVDKKLRATLRFGERREANDYWIDTKNGIVRNLSIGYQIQATDDQDKGTYRVTKWMPYEASLVSVPADPTVGVGRSQDEAINHDQMVKIVADALEKEKTRENPDDSEGEEQEEQAEDPMIDPQLSRKVAIKEKLIIMET